MARWLFSLMLWSGIAGACYADTDPTLLELLSDSQNMTPQQLIQRTEKDYPGVIAAFEAEVQKGQLCYEIRMINTEDETISQFEFAAKNGRLIKHKVTPLGTGDQEILEAVQQLRDSEQRFSDLLSLSMGKRQAHILEAQLDQDLGISYLELKLIDDKGQHKIAFDIEHQRPLPLLKWD